MAAPGLVRLDFEAMGVGARIEAEAALAGPLAVVFGTFPASRKRPVLRYGLRLRGGRWTLAFEGKRLRSSPDPIELVSFLEGHLIDHAAERSPGWLLHAAALARGRRAVVLAGDSGAGKSTLCAALVARGWRYLTDERAALDAKGRVTGLARPIGLAVGDRVPRGMAGRGHPAEPERMLLHLPPRLVARGPVPVRLMVWLRHDAMAAAGARALTPGTALARLWPHCVKPWPDAWRVALAVCARVPAIALNGRTVAGACAAIERHCSRIGG